MDLTAIKRGVARMLCHPLVGRAVLRLFGSSVPTRGMRIALGPAPDPSVAARLFWGFYESAEIRLVDRFLRRDLDVVELGGSIGVVSSVIGRRLEPGRRLVVVEAVAELVPCIHANVVRSAPDVRLEVIHGAVDYRVPVGAPVSVLVERDSTRGAVSTDAAAGRAVPAVRLSDLLAQESLSEFVLVCDIEGAEWDLVERDLDALKRCRQIILETHDSPAPGRSDRASLLAALFANGFVERHRHGPVVCLERTA